MDKRTKKKAARHVIYEMQMFAFTFNKLHADGLEPLVKNALVESCVIHAYNLYRFLYQGETEKRKGRALRRRPTDMIAEDYIERKAFYRKNRSPKRLFRSLENKRNKQIAHLTYDRVKMRGWNKTMFRKLWETVDVFLKALPEEWSRVFVGEISGARQRIAQRR
jgi:hypothetical protein